MYICSKLRIWSALALKKIEASFIFLARLFVYLRIEKYNKITF